MNATLARLTRLAVDFRHERDAHLLDRFLAGSQPAFRELVTRHGDLVFGVCQRILRHRQDAEDAYQAVFLVLARRAADVWPRDAVGSWLYGIAWRVAMKARLRRSRRVSREHELADIAETRSPGPEPDLAEVIDRAVCKLPDIYRAAVIACDLEGLSRKDAAGQLGWSEGTLSGRLARARRLLAYRLRRVGLALPAGGLSAVLGTNEPVRAGLEEGMLAFVSSGAAPVPAPVAALTEGVVTGMIALKIKYAVAAVVVVCALGLGAWAGADEGSGAGTQPAPGNVLLAQSTKSPAPAAPATPARESAGLELLQGRWRIAAMGEGSSLRTGKDVSGEITFQGTTLRMPYREVDGAFKTQEFRIAIDDTRRPKTIDLIAPRKPVGRGIYEFIAPQTMCSQCHDTGMAEHPGVRHLHSSWLVKSTELHATCLPGDEVATRLRLAIALEGERPARFAGEKVVVFTLERIDEDATRPKRARLELEKVRLMELLQLAVAKEQQKDLQRLLSKNRLAAAELEVEEARALLRTAAARCDEAQAQVERMGVEFTLASRRLQEAQARLDAAEKAVTNAGQKPPAAESQDNFTIHIRPLAASERVIRVMAGDKTVLEALALAAQDMAIKPEAFSAWIARGKEILTVDLVGLMQRGETTTNYLLKAGDQLFVQTRVGK